MPRGKAADITAETKPAVGKKMYQLKITLKSSRPPIWRRVLVPGDMSLADLHEVIQIVMGWTNSHLHDFTVGSRRDGVRYSPRVDPEGEPLEEFFEEDEDEAKARLQKVAPAEKSTILYTYDMGDDWEHTILVEKVLPADANIPVPVCLAGKRSGPPEDCGGVWGYAEMLEALSDPNSDQYDEFREWIGDDFDPEAFDLEEINKELEKLRPDSGRGTRAPLIR